MKKFVVAMFIISIMVSGFIGNFGAATPSDTPKHSHSPNPNKPTPDPTPAATDQPGNGNGIGNGGIGNGNGNGNSGTNDNNGNNANNSNNGNGNSGTNSNNGNNGNGNNGNNNGNVGTGNNGNGNGNDGTNDNNGNNGNANGNNGNGTGNNGNDNGNGTKPTLTPTPTPPEPSNSTLPPSVVLFGGGAKWASPKGTKALYVSWRDNYDAHGLTDGQDWGPWFDVPTMDTWKSEIVQTLQQDGFTVTSVGDIPQNITGYDLVVLEAFWAIEPRHQTLIKNFVSNGGGVVMLGATPCFFSVYCKDRWPYRAGQWPTGPGGTDLTSLSDWFGYQNYVNVGGSAYSSIDNPFGTSLLTSDKLFYTAGGSAASVFNPVGNTTVIAQYNSTPFAFTHTYGAGRLYWQGHIWPF